MLAIGLLLIGIVSRLIIHTPNFTPVIALALFGGVYLKNKKYAVILPLTLMAITDMFLGFHNIMLFTWGSIALIAFAGIYVRKNKTFNTVFSSNVLSAVAFFVVTNIGVWASSGMYTLDFAGLTRCFMLAVPFFRMTLLSTVVYAVALFGVYELAALKLKNTKLAFVL
ncbi:MAG: hypothetical protein P9X22_00335 [Candidatus Zapsychrus exili]|nr:hypothetical protein [Candidatus Zapsychrus exili]